MLEQDYIAKILNFKDIDIILTNVESSSGELHLYIELPQRKHECPQCGRKVLKRVSFGVRTSPVSETESFTVHKSMRPGSPDRILLVFVAL